MVASGGAGDATEDAVETPRLLVTAVGHDVLISRKLYLDLVRVVTDNVQKAKLESGATSQQFFEKKGKIVELELKVRLLTSDSVAVLGLKKQLASRDGRITVLEESSANVNKFQALTIRNHDALQMVLDLDRVVISLGKRVNREITDGVCKGYS